MSEESIEALGQILNLQRLSTEDGPGIRTTIFFKGCPLNCAWCHNPESILRGRQIQWLENRCIGCNTCIMECPQNCLTRAEDGLQINREACSVCGICVENCPANALEILGRDISLSELLKEVSKDRAFFEKSEGGVTFSGGEPTLQPDYVLQLAKKLRQAGIRTALDTCGLCSRGTLESLLPFVDTILFDIKIMDEVEHQRWTGQSNRVILENLKWLSSQLRQMKSPVELWIRTPLIPGATDLTENILAISHFLDEHCRDVVQRWELCAFNNLCRDKYRRLDLDWEFGSAPLMTRSHLESICRYARQNGFPPDRIFLTGASKVEEDDERIQ